MFDGFAKGRRPNRVIIITAMLFLVFDATVLGLGYWIAHQVAADAVTINLAGRQRMLSQRMVKALLLAHRDVAQAAGAQAAIRELRNSVELFDSTLQAFAHGGQATGGDGSPVQQAAIDNPAGATLIAQTLALWAPYRARLLQVAETPAPRPALIEAASAMARNTNLQLLSLANKLTSNVELQSTERTRSLRILQVTAFALALGNFLVLMRSVWRQMRGLYARSERMQQEARVDALTRLPNRTLLIERLRAALHRLDPATGTIVVGFLDLNAFKPINDRHGHDVGDEVLKQVAERLRRNVRNTDMVARIGGDEFIVLLEGVSAAEHASAIFDKLSRVLREPFRVQGDTQETIGSSIGAVLIDNPDCDPEEALRLADKIMYEVKRDPARDWQLETIDALTHSTRELMRATPA